MEKFCNNCGNIGHVYRECKNPILSYGIIMYHKINDITKIILIERKNSIAFIEFIRGKYDINNPEYIQLLIDRMNLQEKKLILSENFDTLWENLWVDMNSINNRIKREYEKSKINFDNLKKRKNYNLIDFIKKSNTNYLENEWEIPKGRRNNKEKNKSCAIREFEEETNISENKYKLINNIVPLIEEYKGINNVNYKHVYYIAKINEFEELGIDYKNKNQILEVNSIQWLTKQECLQKIRKYSKEKLEVIEKFFNFIENINDNNIKNI